MSDPAANRLRVVLLGPPASGKGTQGRMLAAALGLGYLSTGALLREQVENATALGKLAGPILARGEYLPDDLMCRIIADWLDRHQGGWVLDGFPRSLPQAEFLDGWLAGHGLKLDAALLLEVPYDDLISRIRNRVECPECRWSGQQQADGRCPACSAVTAHRPDDSEENFANRHQEFERLTKPVTALYQEHGLLETCDATAPQEEVAAKLLQLLSH